ncbi:MAG: hypothetical protein R3E41_02810 [Burkholderiaceae bacterium]
MAAAPAAGPDDPRRVALMATLHCLAGCAIGEIAGMRSRTLAIERP